MYYSTSNRSFYCHSNSQDYFLNFDRLKFLQITRPIHSLHLYDVYHHTVVLESILMCIGIQEHFMYDISLPTPYSITPPNPDGGE
jgi:hypothetical protein